ncbi:hypothetical protein [Planktotalea sp.]|uniref:hypothetical protein n=1 Tax=Planktotalea sp. TaxID=2029877 RepID=UPI003D6B7280
MTTLRQYSAFGLTIQSDRPLPTLSPSEHALSDVIVRTGRINELSGAEPFDVRYRNWQASKGRFLLEIENIARFLVKDGAEIWVDPAPDAALQDVDAYLLGSAFAALLQQREILTLHASAIATEKGAVLFLGKSGAGKSTLLAAMLDRGYRMLSDDISALSFSGPDVQVHSAFPTVRLMDSALERLDRSSDGLTAMRADKAKFLLPVGAFAAQSCQFFRAYLLTPEEQEAVEIQPLERSAQFRWLTQLTFRKNYYRGHGMGQFLFDAVTNLVQQDALRRAVRPSHDFQIEALADAIVQDIK